MTDERVRALERAWRASRSDATLTELLQARLRAGTLERPRLELAASWGHAPSIALLGKRPGPSWQEAVADLVRRAVEIHGHPAVVACTRGTIEAVLARSHPRLGDEQADVLRRLAAGLPAVAHDVRGALHGRLGNTACRKMVDALEAALGAQNRRHRAAAAELAADAARTAIKATRSDEPVREAIRRHLVAWALGLDA